MLSVTPDQIEAMANAIAKAVDPEQIIIFGSQARGDAGPDSDVDFLIITSEPFGPRRSRRRIRERAQNALKGYSIHVDVVLFSRDEVERWSASRMHVVGRAMLEGQIVYQRSDA